MKQIQFRQTTPYGCGMYAVANVMNEASFITPERLEESMSGNNMFQLNKWLQEDGKDFYIDPLYCNLAANLPPSGFGLMPTIETQFFPFLLDIKHTSEGKGHLVGGYSENSGKVVLLDSMKDDEIHTNWPAIVSGAIYNFVYGVWAFAPLVPDGKWKMLEYSETAPTP